MARQGEVSSKMEGVSPSLGELRSGLQSLSAKGERGRGPRENREEVGVCWGRQSLTRSTPWRSNKNHRGREGGEELQT